MTPDHIDTFYEDCARILVAMYQAFPRTSDLWVVDLIGEDTFDEFGMHSDRHMRCLGAMQWLAEEGLLRFNQLERHDGVSLAVLTAAGFKLLTGLTGNELAPPAVTLRFALNASDGESVGEIMSKLLAKL